MTFEIGDIIFGNAGVFIIVEKANPDPGGYAYGYEFRIRFLSAKDDNVTALVQKYFLEDYIVIMKKAKPSLLERLKNFL